MYGTYKLKSTKGKKTTYDTEKAIADQAAADAAAAQAAASQPAESYDSNDYSYDYSGEDYSGGDDYSGGEDGGDGCLDNGLLGLIWGKAVSVVMDRYLEELIQDRALALRKAVGSSCPI